MRRQRPQKPNDMNGSSAHLWDAIDSLRGRVDGLYTIVLGGVAVGVAVVLGAAALIIALG